MKIDRDEARRIAALAHLEFDDEGLDRMAAEMTKILGYIETLPGDFGPRSSGPRSPVDATPLREDNVTSSVDRNEVARNAPEFENGFFIVPAVIEGES
jgi:aspartyl-tRNA(Asn)/glutamyl-tRNA(Gln) amidotransferase subunit C